MQLGLRQATHKSRRAFVRKLGSVISEIRARRGETQESFGKQLGVGKTVISRYEADKVIPSLAVLYHLQSLANSLEEKEAIGRAIKESGGQTSSEAEFIALAKRTQADLEAIIRQQGSSSVTRETFRDLAVRIAGERYIPLWLLEILKLWRRHGREPEGEQEFNEAVAALDRRLDEIKERKKK
jgi:transcriptional regulator with XRE-family HTH domain